ncbi:hypothetical protein [Oharaeibacter diazotrophicus]|uniref:Oligosaccharide repeat unit polymerase n=1 Tax=Oharaeibacter diazotrophicus TaxID=1920512 RepID=A0A4R6R8G2_9HYPH|nr:hypothetical protein [Oharaeibacter diazotrophicus]TDP82311.1 hypothetical protein EDD54_3578 [Oharaeibacter diazotrophicus]BBE72926.1 hypothetical protein OHA_1_02525 [Pleomorphomonas sp. SM30]GLS76964.1 hypothetical protein GCM10007904_23010 [Oharaeibacter diazotrophicus]
MVQGDVIRPATWEVIGLGLLTLGYLLSREMFDEGGMAVVNVVGPGLFGLILCGGALRIALIDRKALWLPYFWFRLSCGIYFGLGTSVRAVFNDLTNHIIDSYYWIQPSELFKVNVICSAGGFLFYLTSFLIHSVWPFAPKPPTGENRSRLLFLCAATYCTIGYTLKFAVVVPYTFVNTDPTALPGIVLNLTHAASVGLFLLTVWCARYARRLLFVPTLLLCADMLLGSLQLAKVNVLLPLILYLLGLVMTWWSPRTLIAAAAVVWVTFLTLVPAVQYGRAELERRTGSINIGTVSDRLEILGNYMNDTSAYVERSREYNSLSRMYYAHVMAASVTSYDNGNPGYSLYNVLTVLIPRSLWPEKPVYNVGATFNLMVIGDDNSSTWMGLFAEAYWNFGWWGLPIMLIPLALGYEVASRLVYDILQRERWLHFPVVMLSAWCGMRSDSDFATTQFAMLTVVFVLMAILDKVEPAVLGFIGATARRAPVAGA